MKLRTLDGDVIDVGEVIGGGPDDSVQIIAITSELLRASLEGKAMSRAIAIAKLSAGQRIKIFGRSMRPKGGNGRWRHAQTLLKIGLAITNEVTRAALADATVRELQVAAKYRDPEAQITSVQQYRLMKRLESIR